MKKSIIGSILLAFLTISTHAQNKKDDYRKAFLELVKSADNDFEELLGEKVSVGDTETRYACNQPIFGKMGYFVKDAEGIHYKMENTNRSELKKMAKVVDAYIQEILKSPLYRRYFNSIRTDIFRTSGETQGNVNRYLVYTLWDDYKTGLKTLELTVYGKSIKIVADPNAYTRRFITTEQLQKDIAEKQVQEEKRDPNKPKTSLGKEDMDKLVNANTPTQSQQSEAARHQQEMEKQARDTEKIKNGTWNGH